MSTTVPFSASPDQLTLLSEYPKKSNHRANIIRIASVLPHNNADNLELIPIPGTGYQVVARKGDFKTGDLGVYIQPDSVVPQTTPFEFIWKDHVGIDGTVPERRRRITVRKFRGEWSEGLLLPISDFHQLNIIDDYGRVRDYLPAEGEDVSALLDITHYDPDAGVESTVADTAAAPKRKRPRTLKGWFFFLLWKLGFRSARSALAREVSFHLPVYDVESLKNHASAFQPGEMVHVTEKIHGSNARFVCIDGEMYAGSRQQWKQKGEGVWWRAVEQNPDIEAFCRTYPGYALYGEVTPTQKGFDYGAKKGQVRFFAFDILTPDGEWLEPQDFDILIEGWKIEQVPPLYVGQFDKDRILGMVDGPSQVPGANHIREGVVVKAVEDRSVRGLRRLQLKIVSNSFLKKDSE